MPVFIYRTERIIEIVADTEDEADRLVQGELYHGEMIVSVEEEDADP